MEDVAFEEILIFSLAGGLLIGGFEGDTVFVLLVVEVRFFLAGVLDGDGDSCKIKFHSTELNRKTVNDFSVHIHFSCHWEGVQSNPMYHYRHQSQSNPF